MADGSDGGVTGAVVAPTSAVGTVGVVAVSDSDVGAFASGAETGAGAAALAGVGAGPVIAES